jgi:hypothetical protein
MARERRGRRRRSAELCSMCYLCNADQFLRRITNEPGRAYGLLLRFIDKGGPALRSDFEKVRRELADNTLVF